MNRTYQTWQRGLWILSLILAPLFTVVSHFFGGGIGINATSGWLTNMAFVFWIPALFGLFYQLRDRYPVYATVGFLIAVYACVAGSNFGVDGIYMEAMGIDTVEGKNAFHENFGIGGTLAFYLPGIFFPISLIVLGIALMAAKKVPVWMGVLLILAGIGFPLSRIPRDPVLGHIDNGLLFVSHLALAIHINRSDHN